MTTARAWTILVATDGTREARAAVAATTAFPWPRGARVSGVIARRTLATRGRPPYVLAAFDRMYRRLAASTRRSLTTRWPQADVRVVDAAPAQGILAEARRAGAAVIVMGSRARALLPRLLLGSVARRVVRRASCATLVVRGRPCRFVRFTVGVDGSAGSRQAIDLVATLSVPRGGQVTLVAVVEPVSLPVGSLVPAALRRAVVAETIAENARRNVGARRRLAAAARVLARAGWKCTRVVREGQPLVALLRAATETQSHLIVVGARGTRRTPRWLLGSVTAGLLNQAACSVLVAGPRLIAERTRAR